MFCIRTHSTFVYIHIVLQAFVCKSRGIRGGLSTRRPRIRLKVTRCFAICSDNLALLLTCAMRKLRFKYPLISNPKLNLRYLFYCTSITRKRHNVCHTTEYHFVHTNFLSFHHTNIITELYPTSYKNIFANVNSQYIILF